MKFLRSLLILVLLIAALLPTNVGAVAQNDSSDRIIYLDGGRYITVELTVTESRATSTKTGTKTYVGRNSNGEEEWRIILSGTFTYTGSSSTCTASSCSVRITDTDWYVISKSATKSGSSAIAAVTMGRKVMGITTDKDTINIRLTCDKNGNLS